MPVGSAPLVPAKLYAALLVDVNTAVFEMGDACPPVAQVAKTKKDNAPRMSGALTKRDM
jgi:hypothetical protein